MADLWLFTLLGLTAGGAYALTAVGVVTVYRGSGVVNFAQGAFGMAGTYVFWECFHNAGLPLGLAIPIGLLAGAVLGALTYGLAIGPLRDAQELSKLIATLGVLLLLQSIALLRYPIIPVPVDSFLSEGSVTIFGANLRKDTLYVLILTLVLTVVLPLLFRKTRLGMSATALYEQPLAASSVGISPRPTGFTTWTLGGALAACAGIFLLPAVGLSPVTISGLIFPALAAGLIGRFRNYPLTVFTAYAMGIAQALMLQHQVDNSIQTSVPFIVIILALMIRGTTLPGRGVVTLRLPKVTTGEMRWRRTAFWIAVPFVAVALIDDVSWSAAFASTALAIIIGLSVVLLTGFAGQINLAPFAFAGLGALLTANAAARWGWSFEAAVLLGIGVGAAAGALIGLPSIRVRGLDLAIATLGLGLVVQNAVLTRDEWVGAIGGLNMPKAEFFGLDVSAGTHGMRYAFMCLIVACAVFLAVNCLRRSSAGRRLLAVRANERGAAAVGIRAASAKIAAFTLSGAIAGLAGALIVFRQRVAFFDGFSVSASIATVAYTVIGGVGYAAGALFAGVTTAGGVFARAFEDVEFFNEYAGILGGIAVVLILLQHPDGQVDLLKSRLARMKARRTKRAGDERAAGDGRVVAPAANAAVPATPAASAVQSDGSQAWVPAARALDPSTPILEVTDLSVRYGAVYAVSEVSFSLRPGHVLGVVGPNGAGKTSLIDALTGFVRPASGRVALRGRNVTRWGPSRRARSGLVRTFQNLELFADLTVRENLLVAADPENTYQYATGLVYAGKRHLRGAAQAASDLFGLGPFLDDGVERLANGTQHLVATARAVASDPLVVCLDEPTAGSNGRERAAACEVIRAMAAELGMAVLIIEHNLDVISSVCDDVIVLDFGKTIATGTPEEVLAVDAVRSAYLGIEAEAEQLDVADTAPPSSPVAST